MNDLEKSYGNSFFYFSLVSLFRDQDRDVGLPDTNKGNLGKSIFLIKHCNVNLLHLFPIVLAVELQCYDSEHQSYN